MNRLNLSNLQLRSNLLSTEYQQEMGRLTIFEVKNIWDRTCLKDPEKLTPEQRQQWTDHLFWGQKRISLEDGDRARAWLEMLAEAVPAAIFEVEGRPDQERAFEILVVVEQLLSPEVDSHYRAQAIDWKKRLMAVLARDEFRLPSDQVEQRLSELLGRPISVKAPKIAKPVAV
jgi:hypothetical protein